MEGLVFGALTWLMILLNPGQDRVVLLPGADGLPSGEVVVKTAGGEKILNRSYAAADIDRQGGIRARQETAEAVRDRYAAALDAQPQRPVSYTVYFLLNKDELTPDSLPVLEQVKAGLRSRSAPEIVVIGHTDRVGSVSDNDALSLKRAETMRTILVGAGIPADRIEVAGRGEREPQVPTADEVPEPRNRRVEINVR